MGPPALPGAPQCLNCEPVACLPSLSSPDALPHEDFAPPDADEVKRTVGPIVKALADVVSPQGAGAPGAGYKERLKIDFGAVDPLDGIGGGAEREDTLKRRLGVHAAAYLARALFGCPGLDGYDFDTDRGGIVSVSFDGALDAMGDLEGVGGMEWDREGSFAGFLSEHGGDTRWMIAAAAIALVCGKLRDEGAPTGRNDVLEEVHFACSRFTREYLSQVFGEVALRLMAAKVL